jgi:hypothetical protein
MLQFCVDQATIFCKCAEDVMLVGTAYSKDKNFADIHVSERTKGMDDKRREDDHSIPMCIS